MNRLPVPISISDLVIFCGLIGGIAAVLVLRSSRARHVSDFWLLQTSGWILYGASKFFLNPAGYPTVERVTILITEGFAITLVLRAIYRRLLERHHLSVPVVVAIIASPFAAAFWMFLFHLTADRNLTLLSTSAGIASFARAVLTKSSVLLAWSGLYIAIKSSLALRDEKSRRIASDNAALGAQLAMLRYQINPHFLFNALNSVSALVDEDRRRAKEMVRDLSEFLRYSLQSRNGEATLAEEFEAVERYLRIEQIRFEKNLAVSMSLDPRAASCSVPSFLLHPLVENAVKHGMYGATRPLVVDIDARDIDGRIVITVSNSGRLQHDASSTCIGLQNVRERLRHYLGDRQSFSLAENNGKVIATIELLPPSESAPAADHLPRPQSRTGEAGA